MINEVMDGITDAIYKTFGDKYEIYKEACGQGMEEPAFFVRCIHPGIEKQLGTRRKMNVMYSIQYFPESAEPRQEIDTVFERLYDCLELITVAGQKAHGVVECADISNGVLTVTAEYTYFLNMKEECEQMEDFEMKGALKDGSSS